MKKSILFILLISIILALRVSPAVFTAANIPIGKEKLFGIPISIENPHDDTLEYAIRVLPESLTRIDKLDGYEALPDTNWFYLIGGNTLTIPPKEIKGHEIAMHIPDNDAYYNQHYIIESMVVPAEESQFQLNMRVTYFIETESKANPAVPPDGDISIAPSMIEFINSNEALFTIYNNDSIENDINLTIEIRDSLRNGINYENTRNYSWSKEPYIFTLEKNTIKLAPGENREMTVKLPRDIEKLPRNTEAMLFIRCPGKQTKFARLLVN